GFILYGMLGRNRMTVHRWLAIAGLALLLHACGRSGPAQPGLARPATIKDIMDSMVDPSGDFMFESVQEIADETGIHEKSPKTDEEWEEVRHRAFILMEAPNLLVMEGRKVAQPSEKSKNPQVELQPEEIQKLVDGDRASFIRRARRLQDAAAEAIKAV